MLLQKKMILPSTSIVSILAWNKAMLAGTVCLSVTCNPEFYDFKWVEYFSEDYVLARFTSEMSLYMPKYTIFFFLQKCKQTSNKTTLCLFAYYICCTLYIKATQEKHSGRLFFNICNKLIIISMLMINMQIHKL